MHIFIARLKKLSLLWGDIIILYVSLWLALNIRYQFYIAPDLWKYHLISFSVIYFFWLIIFYINGLYDLKLARNDHIFYVILFRAFLMAASFAAIFFYFIPYFIITPKTNLFLDIIISSFLFLIWRHAFNHFIKTPTLLNNVLIIGKNKETEELINHLKNNPQLGYYPKRNLDHQEIRLIFDLIENLVRDNIQIIVTAVDPHKDGKLVKNLYQCLPLKITLMDLPTFYETIIGKIPISAIEEIWFLENLMNNNKELYEALKRAIDVILAISFGVLTVPFYPLVALAIKLNSPGSIFYKQTRVGQDGKIFTLIKFRSMVENAEKNGAQWTIENDSRITFVGNFLRKSRIDELPQTWNVLKNDMSFIGPRPERPEIAFGKNFPDHIPFYQIRHLIKPGLTGWAQVNYHYGASVEDAFEKLQFDLYYLKNRSFALDLDILLKTIKIVLSREGR